MELPEIQDEPVLSTRVIIPEGNLEEQFMRGLNETHDLGWRVLKRPDISGGQSQIGRKLSGLELDLKRGLIEAITIVVDNESEPATTFGLIQDQIASANDNINWTGTFPVPDQAWRVEPGPPMLSIVTLPRLGEAGSIETLIWLALEADEHHLEHAPSVIGFLDGKPTNIPDHPAKYAKAQVSSMLAATCVIQPDLVATHMFQTDKGYEYLLNSGAFDHIVTFLRDFQVGLGDPEDLAGEVG